MCNKSGNENTTSPGIEKTYSPCTKALVQKQNLSIFVFPVKTSVISLVVDIYCPVPSTCTHVLTSEVRSENCLSHERREIYIDGRSGEESW